MAEAEAAALRDEVLALKVQLLAMRLEKRVDDVPCGTGVARAYSLESGTGVAARALELRGPADSSNAAAPVGNSQGASGLSQGASDHLRAMALRRKRDVQNLESSSHEIGDTTCVQPHTLPAAAIPLLRTHWMPRRPVRWQAECGPGELCR